MKEETRKRRVLFEKFKDAFGHDFLVNKMYQVITDGKKAFDAFAMDIGKLMAEMIMEIDREEKAEPRYQPHDPKVKKWGSQVGSVYIGDQKIPVEHPRLRETAGEISLDAYEKLKVPGGFRC